MTVFENYYELYCNNCNGYLAVIEPNGPGSLEVVEFETTCTCLEEEE